MKKPLALVTGASRGIGAAIVSALDAAGFAVAAVATTKAGAEASGAALGFGADVASRDDCQRVVSAAVDALGPLVVLVNNAGIAGENGNGANADDALWHRIFDVNVHGTYNMCNAALPHLVDSGRIINMGSVLSARGVGDQTAYCAAKHAVLGYTRALAHAVSARGITVNCVCPGWVATDMAAMRAKQMNVDTAALAENTPLGHVLTPEEVAACVVWLTSTGARNVTGQAHFLDGGVTA